MNSKDLFDNIDDVELTSDADETLKSPIVADRIKPSETLYESYDASIEKIYVIQPIEQENYKILHAEAVSLIASADAEYIGTSYQKIREVSPSTYIGKGKLSEILGIIENLDNVCVLFNGELSPSQTLNISSCLNDVKVIDRTTLILDIFAKNAVSTEGKLQVELAQLKYIYPRLKGKGEALSRLGGGIGTRGPGESQLETDRRHIRKRIDYLEARLKGLEKFRALQSERRKKTNVKSIALVGYTNTGKSTLMNSLCNSDVYVKDKLFATLDLTARGFQINGVTFLLFDTVGFLQNLPHNIIEAFKSTLESALNCDLALIVCDATGEYETQLATTLTTLNELNFDKPYLVVMNKSEALAEHDSYPAEAIFISAKEKLGLEVLKHKIFERFKDDYVFASLSVPYLELESYNSIKDNITENKISFTDEGLTCEAVIPKIYYSKFSKYIINSNG